jgi:hypothetical protein
VTERLARHENIRQFSGGVLAALAALVLGLIAGFRPFGVGRDFLQYLDFYSSIGPLSSYSDFRFEPGFSWMAIQASNIIGINYYAFAAVVASFSMALKFRTFSGLHHPFLASAYYISCWFPLHENTQIRAAISITILFFAAHKMFQNKWWQFILLCAASSLFHYSAFFGAFAIFISYHLSKYSIGIGIIISAFSGIVLTIAMDYIFPAVIILREGIEYDTYRSGSPNIFSFVNVLTFLFIVLSLANGSMNDRKNKTFLLVVITSFSVLIGFYTVPVMANRMRELLAVFMAFIAFEYKLDSKTLPQFIISMALCVGSLYLSISSGLFSD